MLGSLLGLGYRREEENSAWKGSGIYVVGGGWAKTESLGLYVKSFVEGVDLKSDIEVRFEDFSNLYLKFKSYLLPDEL
jgi:cytochrome bd-type quinol oxidase subunit 2